MNCPSCGQANPSTVLYCQRCGSRMDLTADEIREALVQKAKSEILKSTEFYARQALSFALVLLLIMLTLLVLASGAPDGAYYVPSMAPSARYLTVSHTVKVEIPKLVVPLEPRRRGR